jgi:hypothetical protein
MRSTSARVSGFSSSVRTHGASKKQRRQRLW